MLILIAILYICLASALIWVMLFPDGRAWLARRRDHWRAMFARQHMQSRAALSVGLEDLNVWGSRQRQRSGRFLRRHKALFAVGAPLILIPPLLALVLSRPTMLPTVHTRTVLPDQQIAALLQGERLVPPAPLPPDVFATREVELVRPMLVDASRNWGLLHPEMRQRLLLVFRIMKEQHGYEMALLEGYRSPARQQQLAALGPHVTNAGAFQSWHQFGLAADCAFLRDGKLHISEKDPWAMRGYQLYGEVAETVGLTWGGRWKMMDFGHAELRLRGVRPAPAS